MEKMNPVSISRQLARFVSGLSFQELPQEVVTRAKTLILDALGTAIAGRNLPFSALALRVVKENKGSATVLTYSQKVPAMDAAFVNSLLVTSIAQDDMLYIFHPGAVVIPAALAISEAENRSGSEVITAIVAGYDVMGRVFLGAPDIVPRFRGVPVFGPFGAAAASGKLLGLGEDQLTHALGYAANLSSGFAECWRAGTMEGKFHNGLASRNGVMAALLAREGVNAAETSLEGESGFYQAFARTAPDINAMTSGFGKKFLIMEARSKVYPVCGLEQVPVDLALMLAKQNGIQGNQIAKIVERMPEHELAYPGTNYPGPFTTRFQATMSAQFCIAAAFSGKPVMSYSFYDTGYDDSEVSELVKKVELVGEKGRNNIRIEVTLLDGKQYSVEGGGEEILTPDVDRTKVKFQNLACDFLGKKKMDRVIDMILNLDKLENIKELTRQLSC